MDVATVPGHINMPLHSTTMLGMNVVKIQLFLVIFAIIKRKGNIASKTI